VDRFPRVPESATFAEVHEEPSYFKKEKAAIAGDELRPAQTYIGDLQQSGFDTMRLRVQLYHKLAYPLVTIVMAVLAIPFASPWAAAARSPA
jgi:lipopolysaccharide export LptBFGC system permease protein LptF